MRHAFILSYRPGTTPGWHFRRPARRHPQFMRVAVPYLLAAAAYSWLLLKSGLGTCRRRGIRVTVP
jgi:hypothetical protein